jgi:hypothetical protein
MIVVVVGSGAAGPEAGRAAAGGGAIRPVGTATVAGRASIGPALVFGTRVGEAAAHD